MYALIKSSFGANFFFAVLFFQPDSWITRKKKEIEKKTNQNVSSMSDRSKWVGSGSVSSFTTPQEYDT